MATKAMDPQNDQAPPPARAGFGLRGALAAYALGAFIGGGTTMTHNQNDGAVADYVSTMDIRSQGAADIYRKLLEDGHTEAADFFGNTVRTFEYGPTRHADVYNYCDSYYSRCYDLFSLNRNLHYNWLELGSLKRKLEEDILLSGGSIEQQLLDRVRALQLPAPLAKPEIFDLQIATQIREQAARQFDESIKSFEFAVAKRDGAVEASWEQLLKAFSHWRNAWDNEEASLDARIASIEEERRKTWEEPRRRKFEMELAVEYQRCRKRSFPFAMLDDCDN